LASAEVHVEIAYHGQAADTGDELDVWLSDFWTGAACPLAFDLDPGGSTDGVDPDGNPDPNFNKIGQPHCPVAIVAIHNGS